MKLLGVLEVHRLRKNWATGQRELPWDALFADLSPATRAAVARIARSEVKNYLADLAEQAQVPFGDPAGFIANLKGAVHAAGADPDA